MAPFLGLALLLLITVSTTMLLRDEGDREDRRPHAVYQWGFDRNTVSDLLKANASDPQVDTIYLDITRVAGEKADHSAISTWLQDYLAQCALHGIAVHALAGDPEWPLDPEIKGMRRVADYVVGFNEVAQATGKVGFVGMQFDNEPWSHEPWKQDPKSGAETYLRSARLLVDQWPLGSKVPLGFAIPFWFDQEGPVGEVVVEGRSGSVLEHLVSILSTREGSYLAVMASRNHLEGANGLHDVIQQERREVTSNGKNMTVIVVLESTQVKERRVSYFDQTRASLDSDLRALRHRYTPSEGVGGTAVNDLDGYLALR